jgi:hypothetical protein
MISSFISQWFGKDFLNGLEKIRHPYAIPTRVSLLFSMLFSLFLYIRSLVTPFNGGRAFIYEEDRIECISFNFEIICYKTLLDLLYLSPCCSRDTTSPNLTSI